MMGMLGDDKGMMGMMGVMGGDGDDGEYWDDGDYWGYGNDGDDGDDGDYGFEVRSDGHFLQERLIVFIIITRVFEFFSYFVGFFVF